MRGIFIVHTEKFPGFVLKAKVEEDKRFLHYAAQPVRSVPVPAPDGNQVVGILNADRKTHLTVAALGSISPPPVFGEGVEEKPSYSPLRSLMQTLSIKNKCHRYLTKPVAFAAIARETGGSARSRNTVKARCFCGMDARVYYGKGVIRA